VADASRTSRFIQNMGANGVYQAILILSGLIVPRFILNFYGSELNGLVSSLNQFISGLKIVEAGLAGASILALYKPLADRDEKQISGVLSAVRKLYLQVGLIFLLLVCGLAFLYPVLKGTEAMPRAMVTLLAFALGGKAFIEFFAVSKYRAFLIASQKVWVVSLASALSEFLTIGLIYGLARAGCPLTFVYLALLLPLCVRAGILSWYVNKSAPFIRFDAPPLTEALEKRWDVLYLQILGMIRTSAPVVIATVFLDLRTVSVYAIHYMVLVGVSSILSVLTGAISPGFGNVIARQEKIVLQKASREFEVVFYALVAFFYAVTAVMLVSFVDLYTANVRDADYHQPLFAFLLALDGFFYSIKTPQGMLVTAAGLYRETRVQSTVQGAIIVVFGLMLTPYFGLVGLAVAMILSNVYRTIDLAIFIPRHLTHLSVREGVWRILQTLGTSAIIFLPCHWIGVSPETPIEWVRDAVYVSAWAALVTIGVNLLFQRHIVLSLVRRVKMAFGGAT